VQPNASCGACDRCLAGETQLCRHGGDRLHGVSVDGGLADDGRGLRRARRRRGPRGASSAPARKWWLDDAITRVRLGGTVVVVATDWEPVTMGARPLTKEVRIVPSAMYGGRAAGAIKVLLEP
jgi:threonine dehydrogenase-like Zn-dependent dehydrogenase